MEVSYQLSEYRWEWTIQGPACLLAWAYRLYFTVRRVAGEHHP